MRFCNYIFLLVCICISSIAINAQVPHIKPSRILDAPLMSNAEYENLVNNCNIKTIQDNFCSMFCNKVI